MSTNVNKTTKYLKYAVWGCLYLALITPLLIGAKFIFPFITLKTIYFRTVIEVAAFLYLLLALSSSYYRPKMNKVIWLILGFGVVILLTGLIGVNPYRSFWSTIERGEGFLFISHLLAFCFIASQVFKSKAEWFAFLTGSALVSVAVGLYAIGQNMEATWAVANSAGARFSSTLGNAAYLGAYTLGHFWICFLLFLQRKQWWWKVIFGMIGLFNIYLLIQTQTRGAIVSFVIILFLFGLAWVIFAKNHKRTKSVIAAILIIAILCGLFIWLNKDKTWVKSLPLVDRVFDISLKDITVQSRLYATDSSWQAWQDRFLFGYGWENYNVAFNKYFHAEIYRDAGSQIWFDRAHNTIFDIAVATGLIGLIVYLSIFVSCFIVLIKFARRGSDNFNLALGLMVFLAAHFLQNIFVFDSLPTYVMSFMMLGFVSFLGSYKEHQQSANNIVPKPINLYALSIGVIILILAIYNFNLKPAQANRQGIQALGQFYLNNVPQAVSELKQAIEMNTYQTPELRQKLAEYVISHNNSSYVSDDKEIKNNFEIAIDAMKENIKQAPLDAQGYLYLMALYNATTILGPDYLDLVITEGKKALELSPTRPQIYFEMGRAKINQGQAAEGINYFKKAVALNPATLDSHWNLLTAYILTAQYDKAAQEYKTMISKGLHENIRNLERLAKLYSSISVSKRNYNALIGIYQRLINLKPDQLEYWTKLASLYKEVGEIQQARAMVQEIVERFPSAKQGAEALLKILE